VVGDSFLSYFHTRSNLTAYQITIFSMAKRKANRGEDEGGGGSTKKTKVTNVVFTLEWSLTSPLTDDWTRNAT